MLLAELHSFISSNLHDLRQIRPPFVPYLNRADRHRPDTPASSQLNRYVDAERDYRERRSQILHLPDSFSNRLLQRLADANAMMAKTAPIGAFASSHADAICIRTLLSDGSLIHYLIDAKSCQLQRCILDRSIAGFAGAITVSSFTGTRSGLCLALESPSKILALCMGNMTFESEMSFDAMRLVTGHGWVDNFGQHPICIDADATADLICIGYRHRIGIVSFQGSNSQAPTRSGSNPRPSAIFANRQLVMENTIPFRRYSEILLGHQSSLFACFWLKSSARTILLIDHETSDAPTQQVVLSTFQLHASSEMYRLLNRAQIAISCAISCCAIDHSCQRLAILLADSTAMLIDLLLMACIYQVKLNNRAKPSAISFHPGDAVIAVAFVDGEVQVLDSAFQRVPFVSGQLHLSATPGVHCFASRLSWHGNVVIAIADRGPIFALRLVTGVRVQNEISEEAIVMERLRLWQFDEAVAVMSLSRNVSFRIEMFLAMAEILLGLDETTVVQQLVPFERLSLLFQEFWLNAKESSYADKIRCLYHRFVHKLISCGQIECAFYHALQINEEVLFMDIYVASKSLYNDVLARMAFKKCPTLHIDSDCVERPEPSVCVDVSTFNEMTKLKDWQCHQLEQKNQARLLGVALIQSRRFHDAELLYQKFYLQDELSSLQSFRNILLQNQMKE